MSRYRSVGIGFCELVTLFGDSSSAFAVLMENNWFKLVTVMVYACGVRDCATETVLGGACRGAGESQTERAMFVWDSVSIF